MADYGWPVDDDLSTEQVGSLVEAGDGRLVAEAECRRRWLWRQGHPS